jgi:hypothetical protein
MRRLQKELIIQFFKTGATFNLEKITFAFGMKID